MTLLDSVIVQQEDETETGLPSLTERKQMVQPDDTVSVAEIADRKGQIRHRAQVAISPRRLPAALR